MSQTDLGITASMPSGSIPFVTPPPATATSSLFLRPFSVDEYHRLAELGILRSDERVELLEGIITVMSPIGPRHSTTVELIYRLFLKLLPADWDVSMQRDILLSQSVPQPDVCILRGDFKDYADHKPQAADIGLLIEVSETTLDKDRDLKQKLYAAGGIPEYWIVNLTENRLEAYRRPIAASGEQPAKYDAVETLGQNESLTVTLDGKVVFKSAVIEILH
jgi:Uma2 family endonuclease